jgi:NADH-quinone oxidoreductase subunit E
MLPQGLLENLLQRIAKGDHPRELAVDVMLALQEHYGYLTDDALREGAELLGMTPLELEELATFYDFIYREPVGKYVIRVCDSVVCWIQGEETLVEHLRHRLGVGPGGTTPDGMFTLLPVCCIGYCDRAPAMLINRDVYGHLTPERIDEILEELRRQGPGEADILFGVERSAFGEKAHREASDGQRTDEIQRRTSNSER